MFFSAGVRKKLKSDGDIIDVTMFDFTVERLKLSLFLNCCLHLKIIYFLSYFSPLQNDNTTENSLFYCMVYYKNKILSSRLVVILLSVIDR